MTKFNFSAAVFLVSDVGATARWYRDLLGFHFDTIPRTEPFEWASVRRDNVEIMLQRSEGYERPARDPLWPGDAWDVYFYIDDADVLYESIKDKVEVRRPPSDQPYDMREFEIADLNGYVLVLGQNLAGAA